MSSYDVVVIGAGNGGLTAAASLAARGKKVLLLERHNVPGGCATSFCRGRFEFEVALHQLSGLGLPEHPGPLRSFLDGLGVMSELEFVPMKNLYRVVVPGQMDITLAAERGEATRTLQEAFPAEAESISSFFEFLYSFFFELVRVVFMRDPEATPEKCPLYFKYALKSSQEILDHYFKDPLLKAALSVYWPYCGIPPRALPFSDLATLLVSYIEFKPYHLKGGSQAMSNALIERFLSCGGEVRFGCGARKILVEDGHVAGVITEQGDTVYSGQVISNASTVATYTELIDPEKVPDDVFQALSGSTVGPSSLTLYMGLDCPPEEVGINEATNFVCTSTDMDEAFRRMRLLDTSQDMFLLTCYNLVDEGFSPPGTSQVVIVDLKYAEPWYAVGPHQYHAEKFRAAEGLLRTAEGVFPGLRSHIEEIEVATPLTHMRFLGHPGGAIYGFDQYPKDSNLFVRPTSPIRGLHFAGSWAGAGGFQPTLMSGGAAARAALKSAAGEGR